MIRRGFLARLVAFTLAPFAAPKTATVTLTGTLSDEQAAELGRRIALLMSQGVA